MVNAFENIIKSNLKGQRKTIMSVLRKSPMFNVTALEIKGRMIRVGKNHWVADFASCNYLGFDLDKEIMASVGPAVKKWGVHPSWCRLVASPEIYIEAEKRLAKLIGTEATLIFPTVTLIHIGVIPTLLGKDGVLFLDKSAHETMYHAAKMARDSGSKLISYYTNDFETLEKELKKYRNVKKKLICVDGVYSMTGDYANLKILTRLAKKYGAIVYVDDAHGFGVVGEKPTKQNPYGKKGNGIVKNLGINYDNILYVGGLSKSYSALAAFVGCSNKMQRFLQAYAPPYDLSGPCPSASLGSLIAGLNVNEKKGDELRRKLYSLTKKTVDGLRRLGFMVNNSTYFPIVSVWIGNTDILIESSKILYKNGILVTLGPYPMIPKGEEVLRITVTASNTEKEVEMLLSAFEKIKNFMRKKKYPLKRIV
ncbi:pyridoxal phosphate-dependent aminotransferase family protein [Candidatus Woesearchaeota archaeon]|nr:pyridoxal phosphate-dependent aminotransferase family protein [Candidatus Woesearchaeota archaeon]